MRRIRRWVVLMVALNVLLLAALCAAIWSMPRAQQPAQPTHGPLGQMSEGMQSVYYRAEATLSGGRVDIMLSNGEDNDVAVRAQLMLYEDGRVIGSTGWIDPGYRLESMKADYIPAAGQYPCRLMIEMQDAEGKYIGAAGRSLLLTVE